MKRTLNITVTPAYNEPPYIEFIDIVKFSIPFHNFIEHIHSNLVITESKKDMGLLCYIHYFVI